MLIIIYGKIFLQSPAFKINSGREIVKIHLIFYIWYRMLDRPINMKISVHQLLWRLGFNPRSKHYKTQTKMIPDAPLLNP